MHSKLGIGREMKTVNKAMVSKVGWRLLKCYAVYIMGEITQKQNTSKVLNFGMKRTLRSHSRSWSGILKCRNMLKEVVVGPLGMVTNQYMILTHGSRVSKTTWLDQI